MIISGARLLPQPPPGMFPLQMSGGALGQSLDPGAGVNISVGLRGLSDHGGAALPPSLLTSVVAAAGTRSCWHWRAAVETEGVLCGW